MSNPLATEARELSPGRIQMLDHFLSRGMTLSATDVAGLREALAAFERVREVVAQVKADDHEYLSRVGQHLPGSVVTVAEMVESALGGGES